MVRQGLRTLLGNHANVDVIAKAANGEQAVRLVEQLRPMVVVMDINMPAMNETDADDMALGASLLSAKLDGEVIVIGHKIILCVDHFAAAKEYPFYY